MIKKKRQIGKHIDRQRERDRETERERERQNERGRKSTNENQSFNHINLPYEPVFKHGGGLPMIRQGNVREREGEDP